MTSFVFLLEVEELKMLRFFNLDRLGRTGLEMSKSEGQTQVEQFADKARERGNDEMVWTCGEDGR